MNKPGIVNIRGKEYQTVALRVHGFREAFPSYSLVTTILHRDLDCVVMLATIADESGRVIATGHAEEYRKASEINKTSALENAETSAIGRALAALGLGGTEFASADEVARAISWAKGEPATTSIGASASDLTTASFANLQPEIQDSLRALSQRIVVQTKHMNGDGVKAVFSEAYDNWPDEDPTELKKALWYLLDSKTRSAISSMEKK